MINLKTTCLSTVLAIIISIYSIGAQNNSIFGNKYKFESKLKDKKGVQLLSWTEKSTYHVSDTIVLIIESNKMFDNYVPSPELIIKGLKKGATRASTSIENGITKSYILIYYTPLKTGKIKIPKIKVNINDISYYTKKKKIKIITD